MPQPELKFNSRRSNVYGTHGMVAASQPLAVNAGIEILKKGGNAADAAVAVAAALNVTDPRSTGLGGDCFCLFYSSKTRTVRGINGSGRAPATLDIHYVRHGGGVTGPNIPCTNIHSVTVPGAAAGWLDTVDTFGSGKVTMADILAPAITLAEEGFPMSEIAAHNLKQIEARIKKASPDSYHEILPNGVAPVAGQIVQYPTLAKTFRALAETNKDHDNFYAGQIASAIVDVVTKNGGRLSRDDLISHISEHITPVSIDYADVTVWECPPNGQGITALMALGIIRELQAAGTIQSLDLYDVNSAEWIHTLVEALRIAFADTRYHVADPDRYETPTSELLDDDYLRQRAMLFSPEQAATGLTAGSPASSSDTVYFTVVDENGNACSFINSISDGTGLVPEGTGLILQSRGTGFSLDPKSPNCLAGGKRPYHTIIPSMITKRVRDGSHELWASYGVMGGYMQPQGHVQVLLNMLHHAHSPQTALDTPRFFIAPSDTGDFANPIINIEDGVDPVVVEKLRAMGHNTNVVKGTSRSKFGIGQVVREIHDEHGRRVLVGGSDGRGDGYATGW